MYLVTNNNLFHSFLFDLINCRIQVMFDITSMVWLILGISFALIFSRLSRPYVVRGAQDLLTILAIYGVLLVVLKLIIPVIKESVDSIDWSQVEILHEGVRRFVHSHRTNILGTLACFISLRIFQWCGGGITFDPGFVNLRIFL